MQSLLWRTELKTAKKKGENGQWQVEIVATNGAIILWYNMDTEVKELKTVCIQTLS